MTCLFPSVARLDLEIRRGATFALTLEIPGDVPLDQFVWAGELKRRKTDVAVAAEIAVTLLPERWLGLELTAEQTAALSLSRYVYVISGTVGEVVAPLIEGAARVCPWIPHDGTETFISP